MINEHEHWFAARTRANQELGLRNSLLKLEIKHYLPTQVIIRQISGRIKQVEVPIIKNLIFIKTTMQGAFSLTKEYALKISYIKDSENGSLLVVPEKQMIDFMFLMDFSKDAIHQCSEQFVKGDRVKIVKGELSGIEGELIRLEGKSYVLLRIPQVVAVSVKIPRSYLKKLKSK